MILLNDPVIQWGLVILYAGAILMYTNSFLATALVLVATAIMFFLIAIYENWDKIKAEYKKEFKDE